MNHNTSVWWKEAIGYQIYPKTFYDGNGDGIGDIEGIIQKIPYLHDLGIDFLWICPFFDSPMDDNGYDVKDYYRVLPTFGSMDDFKELIHVCNSYDIKIIIDLVLNHTSDEHRWFESVKKDNNSPYKDYYYIQKNKGKKPPNNWGSFFGGSAWESLNENESYLKIFSKKMPDLNWTNSNMRQELYDVASYWMDLGIAGFRIDAIAHIAKMQDFKDSKKKEVAGVAYDWSRFSNLPEVYTYLDEFKKEVLNPYECFCVGEVGGKASVEDALKYVNYQKGAFQVVFTFDHIWCNNIHTAKTLSDIKTDIPLLKETLKYWQEALYKKAWASLYLNNHDFNRVVSNYGSVRYHEHSAKALATMMYLLWGTVFIYQGEEIGMTNYPFDKIEDFQDVQAKEQYDTTPKEEQVAFLQQLKLTSRDNVRTTMQWDDTVLGGFSTQKENLLTNQNYKEINVKEQQRREDSIFNFYKKLIQLKKKNKTFIYGSVEFVHFDERVMSYYRVLENETYLVLVNLSEERIPLNYDSSKDVCILTNVTSKSYSIQALEPFDAYVLKCK